VKIRATENIKLDIVDVNGSFRRLYTKAPKLVREALKTAIAKAADRLSDEMYDGAPPRSEFAPHVKDAIDAKQIGLSARVGILDGDAPSGTEATMGEVALYNEYGPNQDRAFLLPAAWATERPLEAFARKALEKVEAELSIGGL
jgi:hypothetical protein